MKYVDIPKFGQLVEYVTQAEPTLINGEMVAGVIIHSVDLEPESILAAAESIKADYEKVADVRPVQSDPVKVDAIKAEVVKQYCDDVAHYVVLVPELLPILDKITEVKSYKEWQVKLAVKVGEVYLYRTNGNLYKVIQAHTTQSDWTPDKTPALWLKFHDPSSGTYPAWVQPTGAHNAYNIGDKVTFNGRLWESKINANVWSPTVYPAGWKDLGIYP